MKRAKYPYIPLSTPFLFVNAGGGDKKEIFNLTIKVINGTMSDKEQQAYLEQIGRASCRERV